MNRPGAPDQSVNGAVVERQPLLVGSDGEHGEPGIWFYLHLANIVQIQTRL